MRTFIVFGHIFDTRRLFHPIDSQKLLAGVCVIGYEIETAAKIRREDVTDLGRRRIMYLPPRLSLGFARQILRLHKPEPVVPDIETLPCDASANSVPTSTIMPRTTQRNRRPQRILSNADGCSGSPRCATNAPAVALLQAAVPSAAPLSLSRILSPPAKRCPHPAL